MFCDVPHTFSKRMVLRFMCFTYMTSIMFLPSGLRRNMSSVQPAPLIRTFFPLRTNCLPFVSLMYESICLTPKSIECESDTLLFTTNERSMLYISGVPRLWHHHRRGFFMWSAFASSEVTFTVLVSPAARVTGYENFFPSNLPISFPLTSASELLQRVASTVSHASSSSTVSTLEVITGFFMDTASL